MKHIAVKHIEGSWTPHLYFQRRIIGRYRDISTGFQHWRTKLVGTVTPF